MLPPIEEIEYVTSSSDTAEPQPTAIVRERRSRFSTMSVVVVLLVALCGIAVVGVIRLGVLVERTESLLVEQQRTTCYERLQWLGDSFTDHPESGELRAGASRQCEGDEPLIEFEAD